MNKKIIGIAVGAIISLSLVLVFFYQYGISAVSSQDEDVIVKVEKGSGANQILKDLDAAGLVNNEMCGKVFLKLNHFDSLKANTYILNKNMNLKTMFEIMQDPKPEYVMHNKLTIKEGQTIPLVAKEFARILKISDKEVIKQWSDRDYLQSLVKEYWFIDEHILDKRLMFPLEGYLYPETYFIHDENMSLKDMTKLALDMMNQKITPFKDDIKKMNWSVHEFLSFASVVEREAGQDDTDRPMIAGVFINRLKQNMPLQSDITVNYALQKTGVNVSINQTQINSPYNTYKNKGLPVGPVSTIPLSTMQQVIHYTPSDYLYFVAIKDEKNHARSKVIYTKTYQDHLKEVKKAKDAGLWLE